MLTRIAIAAVLTALSTAAIAQTAEEQQLCMDDAFKVCSNTIPDRNRTIACMVANKSRLSAGCQGVSAINTIRSVIGVNLETLRPEPTVEGYSTPGGYSSKAVKPIALRMCMEISKLIESEFPGRTLSGLGGVESGEDAAQFILLGSNTVQVCTGVMKFGYECVKPMCDQLLAFMEKHGFETLDDFRGASLPYFTTHTELVRMQKERKAAQAEAKKMVKADGEWNGDDFVAQSDALATGDHDIPHRHGDVDRRKSS